MRISKKLVAVGVAVGTLAVAGVGYAYWTANGSGAASAKAASAIPATVTAATPSPNASLWPGGSAVPVNFSVDNPNPYPVTYSTFSDAAISGVTPGPLTGTCGTGDFELSSTSGNLDVAVPVAANDSGETGAATILKMKSTAGDACQGAAVTVSLKVAGVQTP